MATCTTSVLNNGLYLLAIQIPAPADVTQCSGSVLLSPTEYSTYLAYTSMPSSADLKSAFEAGFILPMGGFVIAYLVGRLVQMFND